MIKLDLLKKFIIDSFLKSMTLFGTPLFYLFIVILFIDINQILSLKLFFSMILLEIFGIIVKLVYHKPRPNKRKVYDLVSLYDAGSFPSIHTARIALLSFLFLYYNFSLINFLLFLFLVLGVGYSRIYLKDHYLIDVIFGFLFGIIFGYIFILF